MSLLRKTTILSTEPIRPSKVPKTGSNNRSWALNNSSNDFCNVVVIMQKASSNNGHFRRTKVKTPVIHWRRAVEIKQLKEPSSQATWGKQRANRIPLRYAAEWGCCYLLVVQKDVWALNVSVEKVALVAEVESKQQLLHERRYVLFAEWDQSRLEKSHQVMVHVLKHKVESSWKQITPPMCKQIQLNNAR